MKLAETLLLLPELVKTLSVLRDERESVSTITYDESKGKDSIVSHEKTVCDITDEINKVSGQIRTLKKLISKANIDYNISWEIDGSTEITLNEAITLIQQMQVGQNYLNSLARIKTTSRYPIGASRQKKMK